MKVQKMENMYFIRLDKGDDILESISQFVKNENILSGTVSGIGAVENLIIGYFNTENKKYKEIEMPGDYELLSLNGNITWYGDDPVIHLHIAVGDSEGKMFGGHLIKGRIAVTGEIFINALPMRLNRKIDENFNLKLTDF